MMMTEVSSEQTRSQFYGRFSAEYNTGGRDPPLAQCGLKKVIVETLNNVGHHQAYRIERL